MKQLLSSIKKMKEIYKNDSTENYEISTKTIDSPY